MFSCPLKRGAGLASVCARYTDGGKLAYAQFRLGSPPRREVAVPSMRPFRSSAVRGGISNGPDGGSTAVSFEGGGTVWAITDGWGGIPASGPGDHASIVVSHRGRTVGGYACEDGQVTTDLAHFVEARHLPKIDWGVTIP